MDFVGVHRRHPSDPSFYDFISFPRGSIKPARRVGSNHPLLRSCLFILVPFEFNQLFEKMGKGVRTTEGEFASHRDDKRFLEWYLVRT